MDEYISREETVKVLCEKCRSYYYHDGQCIHRDACAVGVIQTVPVADVQPVDRWVSIEDSLPKPYSKVILYTKYKAIAYGFFRGEYYEGKPLFSMTMSNNAENSWYEEVRITHWQPLPAPPKEG